MVRYRLDDLGWYQFEWLCQSLLKAYLGLGVEAWGGYSDLGRDAYTTMSLPLVRGQSAVLGPTVFQAKFVEEANAAGAKSWGNLKKAIGAELVRVSERVATKKIEMPGNLVILTNAPISATNRIEYHEMIQKSFPEISPFIWGAEDISAMLDDAPNIRVAFPQLLSIRDLQDLLASVADRGIITRSSLAVAKAKELSAVFVPTRSYSRTLQVLNLHNFAVLTGPPEVGKTTIARLVGLAKLGEGWECLECRTPEDILTKHRFENPQVFIADDAFGTTDFQPEIAHMWSSDLDDVIRLLDSRHWLIWTSRHAPLHAALARMHLQGRAEHFPKPGEILVDAAKLSANERALILYRHAKNAKLDEEAKALVKSNASLVVANEHFTPERAARFIRKELPELVKSGASDTAVKEAISAAIEQPTISMKKSYEALSDDHQSILISMLDSSSGSVTRKGLLATIDRHTGGRVKESLIDDLSSHFLRCSEEDCEGILPRWLGPTEPTVGWMHPSWRDLIIDQIANDSVRRRAFLANCALPGFKLAISVAGGASGVRTKPFLQNDDDWDALQKSLPRLISSDAWSQFSLLKSIEVALDSEKSLSEEDLPIHRIARNALELLKSHWDENGLPDSSISLSAYFEVSEYLNPLPPCPNLIESWQEAWDSAQNDAEAFDSWSTSFDLSAILQWLNLAEVILPNEPRFLRQVKFPDKYRPFVSEVLKKMTERTAMELDLETEEECSDEESRLSCVQEIANKIRDLFPDFEEQAQAVADSAENRESGARGMRSDFEEAAKQAENEASSYPISVAASGSSIPLREITIVDQPLNISRLFRDL